MLQQELNENTVLRCLALIDMTLVNELLLKLRQNCTLHRQMHNEHPNCSLDQWFPTIFVRCISQPNPMKSCTPSTPPFMFQMLAINLFVTACYLTINKKLDIEVDITIKKCICIELSIVWLSFHAYYNYIQWQNWTFQRFSHYFQLTISLPRLIC